MNSHSAFDVYTATELVAQPQPKMVIRGILPREGIAVLYGASGVGKSFLLLQIMAAVGTGSDWFGHPTKQLRALYVVLEGSAGIGKRIMALEVVSGKSYPESVRFIRDSLDITNKQDVEKLLKTIAAIGGVDLVVIDTLNQAAPNIDENSSQGIGAVISASKIIQLAIKGLVLLTHHPGKDSSRGPRGHSSLFAAMDAVIEVIYTNDGRSWRLAKSKDGDDSLTGKFELVTVDLGTDPEGFPLTSCVVKQIESTTYLQTAAQASLGEHEQVAYELFLSRLQCQLGDRSSIPCLEFDEAIKLIKPSLNVKDEKRRGERAKAAVLSLVKNGHVGQAGDYLYLG